MLLTREGLSIRQAIVDDPELSPEPRLTLIVEKKIPGKLIPKLLKISGVAKISVILANQTSQKIRILPFKGQLGSYCLEKLIWQMCFVVVRIKEVYLICHHLDRLAGYPFLC